MKPSSSALALLALGVLAVLAPRAQAQFTSGWADSIVSASSSVSNPGSPTNVLGNTSSTYYDLGGNGQVTVRFAFDYCNSGNSQNDVCVWEWGQADYYFICIDPANAYTEAALIAAGIPQFGQFFEYPQAYCGDSCLDIDAIVPGHPAGALSFDKLMIAVPSGADPEIERIKAYFLCQSNGSSVGDLVFLDLDCDGKKDVLEPGVAGVLVELLDANGNPTGQQTVTDANGHYLFDDLAAISYRLQFTAPSGMTWTQQDAAGSSQDSDVDATGLTDAFMLWVNEATLTIDAGLCVAGCAPGAADVVIASGSNGHKALGMPNGHEYVLGQDIVLGFTGGFTTDGTAIPDLTIVETGQEEDYDVAVRPMNAETLAALLACNLVPDGDLFFDLGEHDGLALIDLDAICPGHPANFLAFDLVRISSSDSDSPDIDAVIATFVCDNAPITPAIAKLGDRIWQDLDRNGIQDAGEPGVNGVTVHLLDAQGTPVGLSDVTEGDGHYLFCVAPGTYRVAFEIPVGFHTTEMGIGSNATDSDVAPDGRTGPVDIDAGETDLKVDAGIVCYLPTVFTDLPSCDHPLEPLLTATLPVIGESWVVTLDSEFPFAQANIFLSLGHPVPIVAPDSACLVYVDVYDPYNFVSLFSGLANAQGDVTLYLPLPNIPSLGGYPLALQAHVCEPLMQGPLPGSGDFLSNGVHATLGCP